METGEQLGVVLMSAEDEGPTRDVPCPPAVCPELD
jgi:hypothetical protein